MAFSRSPCCGNGGSPQFSTPISAMLSVPRLIIDAFVVEQVPSYIVLECAYFSLRLLPVVLLVAWR